MLKRKEENEDFHKEKILKHVDYLFGDHRVSKKKGQFILKRWDGQQITTRSGKTVWGGKGPASNALNNHIGRVPEELKNKFKSTVELKNYLIENGHISIVKVE